MAARGVVVGSATGDRGRLWVADDAVRDVADKLTVANRGEATASIFGKVTVDSADAGSAAGSNGRIVLSGAASHLNVAGSCYLGMRGFGGIWADHGSRVEIDFIVLEFQGTIATYCVCGRWRQDFALVSHPASQSRSFSAKAASTQPILS